MFIPLIFYELCAHFHKEVQYLISAFQPSNIEHAFIQVASECIASHLFLSPPIVVNTWTSVLTVFQILRQQNTVLPKLFVRKLFVLLVFFHALFLLCFHNIYFIDYAVMLWPDIL